MSDKMDVQAFTAFSDSMVPAIDGFIGRFYSNKIRSEDNSLFSLLYEDLREYCLRPGKRIRPLLLLCGYQGYSCADPEGVIPAAATLEMMHSFLLIQDDIIDRANMRRGGQALHLLEHDRFAEKVGSDTVGRDVALVLADVLFSNVMEIIAEIEIASDIKNDFLKIFSKTYERTAFGQILDCIYSNPDADDMDPDIPMQISKMKTAYYTMYYPLLMGYVLSGGKDRAEMERIKDFALPLGVAFQLRDDIIGVFSPCSETGKPNDADINEGKYTLLVQYTYERLDPVTGKDFISMLNSRKKEPGEIDSLRLLMLESGAKDAVIKDHILNLNLARKALSKLCINDQFSRILRGLINRMELL